MNTFKRKALSCAILGGLGAVAGSAHAVYQNPNGLGQALIYPYYTVQQAGGNAYNTYLSIVNTTTTGKALKVRFREGKNSREVLDFNLYMSPNDVWTAAIVPADATTSSPGHLVTADKSCTNPPIPATGVDFRNIQYSGANTDNAGTGLDRTREGYLEVIEMATVTGALLTGITHVNGVPASCAGVQVVTLPIASLAAPTGGIAGSYTLINVQNGADMGGNVTALANFNPAIIYTDLGNEATNLTSAQPVSVVVAQQPTGTTTYTNTFAGATAGVDAVGSTIQHSTVINEYVLDSATKSATDWVLTFPTKRYYTGAAPAITPFSNAFVGPGGACETISFQFFDREEGTGTAAGADFSPTPSVTPNSLCWESTVLSVRNVASAVATSNVLGSVNTTIVNVATGFQNGWARLTFLGTNATTTGITAATTTSRNVNTGTTSAVAGVFRGLPVIGFMARTLFNGTLSCTNAAGATASCQGSYGSLFDHRFEQNITPAP